MVFTTRFVGGRGGRNGFEAELRRLGVRQKNGKPSHPQTQGKWSGSSRPSRTGSPPRNPRLPPSPSSRPSWTPSPRSTTTSDHRSLPHPLRHRLHHPAKGHTRRPHRRRPRPRPHRPGDAGGKVTLRADGRLHHIGIGAAHARTAVLMLVQDLHIRVINAATGELLRDLTLDPTRNYQPTGRPPGPHPEHPADGKTPDPNKGSGSFRCLATSQGALGGTRTPNLLIRSKMACPDVSGIVRWAARRLCGQRARVQLDPGSSRAVVSKSVSKVS